MNFSPALGGQAFKEEEVIASIVSAAKQASAEGRGRAGSSVIHRVGGGLARCPGRRSHEPA